MRGIAEEPGPHLISKVEDWRNGDGITDPYQRNCQRDIAADVDAQQRTRDHLERDGQEHAENAHQGGKRHRVTVEVPEIGLENHLTEDPQRLHVSQLLASRQVVLVVTHTRCKTSQLTSQPGIMHIIAAESSAAMTAQDK